ncbi:MAG: glycosyltransferase family 9 protein [Phycisphaerales bacterium]
MADSPVRSVWVFHRGALGDSVLTWPLLRALTRARTAVTMVSDLSKAKLAEQVLGIRAVSAEHRRFTDLWVTGAADEPGRILPVGGVSRVISFLSVQGKHRTWAANVAGMFPGARIELIDRQLTRELSLDLASREGVDFDPPLRTPGPDAPVVFHLGAGSAAKRWPLHLWARLVEQTRAAFPELPLRVLAGEVEAEQFTRERTAQFDRMGGEFLGDLSQLRDALTGAAAVVVADSGPAHLGAQLGVPVLALFGPTLPALWAPIGPRVTVIAPPTPSAMDWLDAERVSSELRHVLTPRRRGVATAG